MSQKVVLEGVRTTLRKTNNYDNSNTAIGSYKVVNAGMKGGRAAVIAALASTHGVERQQMYVSHHGVMVRVYRRFTQDDGTSYNNLLTDVDTIITQFNKYPKLVATTNVIDSEVTDTSEVNILELGAEGSGVYFLTMDITLEVVEEVTPAAAE